MAFTFLAVSVRVIVLTEVAYKLKDNDNNNSNNNGSNTINLTDVQTSIFDPNSEYNLNIFQNDGNLSDK